MTTDWPSDPTGPRKPTDAPENGRVPAIIEQLTEIRAQLRDLYTQGGRSEGGIDRLGVEVEQLSDRISRLQCAAHIEKIVALAARVERLEVPAGTQRIPKPSEGSEPVKARDLQRIEERTDRLVVSELRRVDETLEGRITSQVTAALQAQRDAERAADERARQQRQTAAAEEAANKDLALSQQLTRWKTIIAAIVALASSVAGAGWCQLSSKQQADTAALTKAVEHRPAPVVVQVPTPVPVPVPTKKGE